MAQRDFLAINRWTSKKISRVRIVFLVTQLNLIFFIYFKFIYSKLTCSSHFKQIQIKLLLCMVQLLKLRIFTATAEFAKKAELCRNSGPARKENS